MTQTIAGATHGEPLDRANLAELVLRLKALVFYRGLTSYAPFKAYIRLLDSLSDLDGNEESAQRAYAKWNSALLAASPQASWAYWLAGRIIQSVNPLTISTDVNEAWQAALEYELEALLAAIHCGGATLASFIQKNFQLSAAACPVYDRGNEILASPEEGFCRSYLEMREKFVQYLPFDKQIASTQLLAFHRRYGHGMPAVYKAMHAGPEGLIGITRLDPIMPEDLFDYSGNMDKLTANTEALLSGGPASHVLLYGTRGCGKSSAVKSMLNRFEDRGLRLIEINPRHLQGLGDLMSRIERSNLFFILFIDDLSFKTTDTEYTELKSFLQGGAMDLPANCRIYVTSNRRHLVLEQLDETEQEIYSNDGLDERISLSDRFGLKLHFLAPLQREYLEVVRFLAEKNGLSLPDPELERAAVTFATRMGHRSPREAQLFIDRYLAERGMVPRTHREEAAEFL